MTSTPGTNWSGSFRYAFRDFHRPSSIDELCEAVRSSQKIKVLGSRHSFNAIADGDVALLLADMPMAPELNATKTAVTIAGHATYGDLAAFLNAHGLAVHNLASLPHISIAGAIATATHGSGRRNGNLATSVSGLQIMTADGNVIDTRRGDPEFSGLVVHLGALGVVTRVTLDVEPSYEVAQSVYEGMRWDALYENLEAIMSAGYSVSVFTRWGDEAGQVWVKRRDLSAEVPTDLHGARLASVKRHPLSGLDPVNVTDQLGEPGLWSDRLPHFKMGFTPSNGDEIQSEFHIPFAAGSAAIKAVVAVRDRFAHLVQAAEFRAVAADDLWLSPQFGRDTLSMHFTWVNDSAGVDAAVRHVEKALEPFDARPHWGKVFTEAYAGSHYPMIDRFKALREKLDPTRKFSNRWLEAVVLCGD